MAKLVFGCGYLGQRVAERWRAAGETVYTVTRSSEHARLLRQRGFEPIVADVVRPATLVDLPSAETVLFAVGFDRAAGMSIHEVYVNGLRAVLDALPTTTGKIIYTSSTGVYGNSDGDWIDEQSPCQPERDAGRACLEAEQVLAGHLLGDRRVILRLAGLYGPGRIPRQRELRAGAPLATPADGYLNLIHVDDAASAVLAAEEHAPAGSIYLVADGQPVLRREYYMELSRLLDAPPPKFEPPRPDECSTCDRASASTNAVSNQHARRSAPSNLLIRVTGKDWRQSWPLKRLPCSC